MGAVLAHADEIVREWPLRYFQVMARIGSSLVHIDGPHELRKEAMASIRKLSKQKPQYVLAEVGTGGGRVRGKVPRKKCAKERRPF